MRTLMFLTLILSSIVMGNDKMKSKWFSWIIDDNSISVHWKGKGVSRKNILIKNHLGLEIKIKKVSDIENGIKIDLNENLIFPANYKITIDGNSKYCYPDLKFLNKKFYSGLDLGVVHLASEKYLRIWSPTATNVKVEFIDTSKYQKNMRYLENGIWELLLDWDLKENTKYKLFVEAFGRVKEALDPYARSMEVFSAKNSIKTPYAFIVDPESVSWREFEKDQFESRNNNEFIGYEVHVRDFSIDPKLDIPQKEKGTYKGLTYSIPYLKDLGITHIQLMPIQSFYTVDELKKEYQGENVSTSNINYNWGYDPHHYFIPEGWYSENPKNPVSRILELKKMVSEFHKNGIGVIMDVVYNHMYDKRVMEHVAPGAYLRRNKFGEISLKSGAGVSLESRNKMVRRLIVESLKYFKDEFHIDGYRFDLMGFTDIETMKEIRRALGDSSILYGEGWEFTDLPKEEATTKSNLPVGENISVFNDTSRDSYAGYMSGEGFVHGSSREYPKVLTGIIGGLKNYSVDYNNDEVDDILISKDLYHRYANSPGNTLNFLTIHDGFTLWDKINLSVSGSLKNKKKLMKMALAMLFTSQGKIVLHGGDEFLRSKPLYSNDPNPNRAHTSENVISQNGIKHFHENSYASSDATNFINWDLKIKNSDMVNYVKNLIKLRKEIKVFRFEKSEDIQKNLRFYNLDDKIKVSTPSDTAISFSDINSFQLKFINGPFNKKLFIVGEVHGENIENKNPVNNQYNVSFNSKGEGVVYFSKSQINQFHLEAWSDPKNLQLKLVKTPGKWDFSDISYTAMGNNTIKPGNIKDGKISIDLSIPDHIAGEEPLVLSKTILFTIDNKLKNNNSSLRKIKKYLVSYNAESKGKKIEMNRFNCDEVENIFDSNNVNRKLPLDETKTLRLNPQTVQVFGCL